MVSQPWVKINKVYGAPEENRTPTTEVNRF